MNCEEAVRAILRQRQRGIIVATMSAIKWVDQLDPDGLNIACVPLMGGAGGLGLGLAVARPERLVLVLDGDGSALMQLSTFVTAAAVRPANYVHFVFNNGVWFENLANIPVPKAAHDYAALARAAGYSSGSVLRNSRGTGSGLGQDRRRQAVHSSSSPSNRNRELWSSENPQPDLKDFHFTRMGDEARRLASALAAGERV